MKFLLLIMTSLSAFAFDYTPLLDSEFIGKYPYGRGFGTSNRTCDFYLSPSNLNTNDITLSYRLGKNEGTIEIKDAKTILAAHEEPQMNNSQNITFKTNEDVDAIIRFGKYNASGVEYLTIYWLSFVDVVTRREVSSCEYVGGTGRKV